MLETLLNGLANSRYYYKNAMEGRKLTLNRLNEYKQLGILSDDEKKSFSRRLSIANNDIMSYRKNALQYARKIKLYNILTGGKHAETFKSEHVPAKMPLLVENDFSLSDEILESGEYTEQYANSEYYYNERVENEFLGTYNVIVERIEEYNNFITVLTDDILTSGKMIDFSVTYEEWKTGYKVEGKRQTKLNKYLNKKGFSKYVLDYYSQQVKTEKTLYLTISDKVHHITGMSYFSTMEWTGISGSSCQDPRNDYEESIRLLPSLHDNKLLIAFLHEELEDIEELEEKMLARSMCRIINVNGKQFLISSKHYGTMETIDEIEKSLCQLNSYNIFTHKQMKGINEEYHREQTNGTFYLTMDDEIYIREEHEDYVNCSCPACGGSGNYTVYTRNDREIEINCPACGGSGEIETYVSVSIDEYVDVNDEEEHTPYNEQYRHYGSSIEIIINKKVMGIDQ